MIRIDLEVGLNYEVDANGADFIFNIHAAHTPNQAVSAESLFVSQPIKPDVFTHALTGNRYLRLRGLPGTLKIDYKATVDLTHFRADPAQVPEVPVSRLPPEVLTYLYPSRYCQSDQFLQLAASEFGAMWQGYSRVQAIQEWVQRRVKFTSNTSNSNTSAVETLKQQVGVCRDFAHLMIALCRAVNIPARFTTGTDFGADPVLGPPDFHAYVEVYLGDRWFIFDPSGTATPMGFVRLGTGRDAADVSVATIFGGVQSQPPVIHAMAGDDWSRGIELPYRSSDALSTDQGAFAERREI